MSKYHNVKVKLDGYTFDSKMEAKRYGELKLLEAAGEITELSIHPKYVIFVRDEKICTYIGDFHYYVSTNEWSKRWVVEDVKGVKTAVYRLKKKLMKAVHGIDIVEVTK